VTRAQYSSNWFGVRAGLNVASEFYDAVPGASSGTKLAPFGGAVIEHVFDDTWALSLGLLFNQKGSKQVYDSSVVQESASIGGNDNISLSYLEIPIVAKMMFGNGDIHPYVFAGPSIGLLMSASEDVDGNVAPVADLKSSANAIEFAINFGGGIVFQAGNSSRFFFDAGYSAGVTSAFKSNPRTDKTFVDLSSAKSGDVRVAIGMLWEL
jgi:hypothetical protein